MNLLLRALTVGGFLALVSGCDSTPEGRQPVANVEVTVTYKGKPVENAVVTYTSPAGPPPAFGKTDANGKSSLSTYEAGDGAVLGSHVVTIVKQEFDNVKEDAPQDSPEYKPSPGASPIPVVKNLLPRKYMLPGTSGLTATVEKGKNEHRFELVD
jgi:hypothetical protein